MTDRLEFQEYFSGGGISRHWLLVRTPLEILDLKCIQLGEPKSVSDKDALKALFRSFGEVLNLSDGRRVRFPGKSVGKMIGQCGVDLRLIASAFNVLFANSVLAWSEPELPIPGHKVHPDVMAYHQYVVKFDWSGQTYFARFTVRESRSTPKSRNDVHAATISRVSLYKMEDATSTGLGQNQAEDIAPFTDKKIAYFFLAVKAVNVAAEKRAKEGMTARERLQLAYEIAFLPRRLNGLFRGWLKDPASVTEDELKALDEAAMLHLPLPQGGYASVRALYRLAAYQAGSCDYGMRGFIDNVRRRLNRPALAVTEVPSGMVKDVVLPKYRVPEF